MNRILPLLLILLPLACNKPAAEQPDPDDKLGGVDPTTYYANLFAFNNMKTYYLWADEMATRIDNWKYGDKPVEKVADCRHEMDRWTMLMEDCSSFESTVTGNGKSFGFDFILTAVGNHVNMVITFVYADSPASKAGLKRGDVANSFDGTELTRENYSAVLTEKIYHFPGTLRMGMLDGSSVTMTATQLYSNPVNVVRTLDVGGKKLGYLHFSNFTLDACEDLVEAFRQFKSDGIEELVVDLRYNSGGFVATGTVLGSLIAPVSVVSSEAVFNKDVYNSSFGSTVGDNAETRFAESFTLTLSSGKKTLNTLEVNPDLKRVWFIVTGQTASASEALICGLAPYMGVTLVGSRTLGQFCGGFLLKADDFYNYLATQKTEVDASAGKKATAGWGLYVIASRYADCNGTTLSMPDGINPHIEAWDTPRDGHPLGDPSETMLSSVLNHISGNYIERAKPSKSAQPEPLPFEKPGAGAYLH